MDGLKGGENGIIMYPHSRSSVTGEDGQAGWKGREEEKSNLRSEEGVERGGVEDGQTDRQTGMERWDIKAQIAKEEKKRQGRLQRQSADTHSLLISLCFSEDDEDEEDEEPLLSGSGTVQKECTEEELGSWSDMLSKWKDVNNRPAQLSKLIRRVLTKARSLSSTFNSN